MVQFTGERLERIEAAPHFQDGRFANPDGVAPPAPGGMFSIMGEAIFGGQERVPKRELPVLDPKADWAHSAETGLRVTWLGHSTVLLELDGYRILTDPVFGERSSPVSFAGPKRFHPPPVHVDGLPELDVVLLSHDHYDHLCQPTFRELASIDVPIVTALGVGARLEAMGIEPERITELDWGQHHDVLGLRLHAERSQHFSGRSLGDRNRTLWASWVLETDHRRVFFSGDTGLSEHFRDVGRRHGPFDLTMLEIGAFHEAWAPMHLGPQGALEVFEMLGGGTLLPVHWGTFNLAFHAWNEPPETLVRLAEEGGQRVLTPRIGQVFEPSRNERFDAWWR